MKEKVDAKDSLLSAQQMEMRNLEDRLARTRRERDDFEKEASDARWRLKSMGSVDREADQAGLKMTQENEIDRLKDEYRNALRRKETEFDKQREDLEWQIEDMRKRVKNGSVMH